MKNSSKKRSPGKNNEYKKYSDLGYYSKKTNRSENYQRNFNNTAKNNNIENLNKNEKNNTFSSLKRRKPKFKPNSEFFTNNPDIQQEFNNKNFDDWIWGKHSVYEALISERAINRIWCTSEIYSSD